MAEADMEALSDEAAIRARRNEVRRKWYTRFAIALGVAAVAWGLWYLLIGRNYVATDNAYVNAEMAQITPLISAPVIEVKVKDTQTVRRGDVLVRLDQSTPLIHVAEAQAELAAARRRFRQSVATNSALSALVEARTADIAQAKAQLGAAQADFDKARVDLARREALAESGAVSGQELTDASKEFARARAALATARAGVVQAQSTRSSAQGELAANEALVRGSTEDTDPGVLAAKAKLDAARLELKNTVIRAPVDGVVTRRQVQVGQRVEQGRPVMMIVPVDSVFVDANFKERQLRGVKVGMPATVTADIYGGSVTYHGKVAGLSGGTGASMSLIPAQNATGNWIKVVQRLPVRIELDPKELAEHPLRVGLSTEVEIDISGD
ncbi:MAG: efflux RND transporter periplasmic adaptor subunit [Novosphingobium sp.]|nr:efflux RND transporter periplasmic adaptor subunit [Novosphingobium sp.]MCP5401390.1 efflux RND transporter periplasmic adaptor subunit [Novosphingobium sp.]